MRNYILILMILTTINNFCQNGLQPLNGAITNTNLSGIYFKKIEQFNGKYYLLNLNKQVLTYDGYNTQNIDILTEIEDVFPFNNKLYFISATNKSYLLENDQFNIIDMKGYRMGILNNELIVNSGQGFYFPLKPNKGIKWLPVGTLSNYILSFTNYNNKIYVLNNNGLYSFDGSDYTKISTQNFYSKWADAGWSQISLMADNKGYFYLTGRDLFGVNIFIKAANTDSFISMEKKYPTICWNKFKYHNNYSIAAKLNGNVYVCNANILWELNGGKIKPYFLVFKDKDTTQYTFNPNPYKLIISSENIYFLQKCIYLFNPNLYSEAVFKDIVNNKILTRDWASDKVYLNNVESIVTNSGANYESSQYTLFNTNYDRFFLSDASSFTHKQYLCNNFIYSHALWCGGLKNGSNQIYTAVARYNDQGKDFYSGAIENKSLQLVNNDALKKVYSITQKEITAFNTNRLKPNYKIPEIINIWPGKKSINQETFAPFVDKNGNGIYDPENGDFPKIKGDMYSWCVFHDVGLHTDSKSDWMGLEIEQEVYEYYNINEKNDSIKLLNNTVFISHKIKNKSTNTYTDFVVGKYVDYDLGDYANDLVSYDSNSNTVWTYNGTDNETGENGLGMHPPFLSYTTLNEKLYMLNFFKNSSDPFWGNPAGKEEIYKILVGKRIRDTLTINKNKSYYFRNVIPFSYKTKDSIDIALDGRMVMALKPRELKPDSVITMDIAIYFNFPKKSTDSNEFIQSINKSKTIQQWYNKNTFPSNSFYPLTAKKKNMVTVQLFPNPGEGIFTINSTEKIDEINVYNS